MELHDSFTYVGRRPHKIKHDMCFLLEICNESWVSATTSPVSVRVCACAFVFTNKQCTMTGATSLFVNKHMECLLFWGFISSLFYLNAINLK